jgi:hypothetical protein
MKNKNGITKMERIEETVFKMTESLGELISYGELIEAVNLLRMIDRLCDSNKIDPPDEFITMNIHLDEKMGYPLL